MLKWIGLGILVIIGGIVLAIAQPSHDPYDDTHEVFYDSSYPEVEAEASLILSLHELWNKLLVDKPEELVLQICHREEAIIVRDALELYDETLRKKISVLAIAPAAYIDPDLCRSVIHYVSTRDPEPNFDRRVEKHSCRGTIVHLNDYSNSSWFDSDFQSPAYREILQRDTADFAKEESKSW